MHFSPTNGNFSYFFCPELSPLSRERSERGRGAGVRWIVAARPGVRWIMAFVTAFRYCHLPPQNTATLPG
jgi:hypothetical protein